MTNKLSKQIAAKLLGSEWSFGYNCYEVGHTWTPSCTDAALEISLAAASRVAPLYALLYGFSQLAIQKRYDLRSGWDTIKSIVRSTSFIFFHFYNGSIIGCTLRHTFGRFYYRVLVCIPAIASSFISLLLEKPARRQALAFYMLNLATEIIYRTIVLRGYFKPMRHGETLLFALSLAAWYNLIKTHGFDRDPVSVGFRLLVGRDEAAPSSKRVKKEQRGVIASTAIGHLDSIGRRLDRKCYGKHASCPHDANATCLSYVLEPIPTRFLSGYLIQIILRLSSRPNQLLQSPIETLCSTLVSPDSIKSGLFLVTLVSSSRLTSCLLRRYSNISDSSNQLKWHAACSGFVAGLSMLWMPRSSLSMYVMWKAIEQYYLLLVRQNKVKYFDFTIMTIYSISAATILYTFALEPKLMRPSYMKFLDNISDHRLHQLNRMVLDVFGTGSSIGYEDYFPDLHPKFMSNQFKELVFNWMIQPYE